VSIPAARDFGGSIALARIGGDEPFRCPAQALVVEAQAV
jgi:hypothetical protein